MNGKLKDTQKLIDRADKNLDRQLDWIARIDSRMSFVTGIDLAMLGALAASASTVSNWSWDTGGLGVLAAVLLAAVLVCIFTGFFPRTTSKNDSLLFFGTIADKKIDQFESQWHQTTDEAYLNDLLAQTHINAEIVCKKFHLLKNALILLLLAAIPWVGFIFFTKT